METKQCVEHDSVLRDLKKRQFDKSGIDLDTRVGGTIQIVRNASRLTVWKLGEVNANSGDVMPL
jgi:hypothetical protein